MKRKGLWIFVILALIAVVLAIVFINLFSDKDTKALAQEVNKVATEGYLFEESEEYKEINQYLATVYATLEEEEKNEVLNSQNILKASSLMIDFYNRQILYSKFTEEYKVERKQIEKDFSQAQTKAQEFVVYIQENKSEGSAWWLANTWVEGKKYMQDIVSNTKSAFERLEKVYVASVDSKIMNNDFTSIIFEATSKLLTETQENLAKSGYGIKLYNFISIYYTLNGEKMIINYNYNASMQNEVSDIKELGEESLFYDNLLDGSIAV